jgi:hypothetical protein
VGLFSEAWWHRLGSPRWQAAPVNIDDSMGEYIHTTNIKVGGVERTVRAFIEAPSLQGLDVQALAQEAWFRPGRMLRKGDVTIIVARFKR